MSEIKLDDAVELQRSAVSILGDGPRFKPAVHWIQSIQDKTLETAAKHLRARGYGIGVHVVRSLKNTQPEIDCVAQTTPAPTTDYEYARNWQRAKLASDEAQAAYEKAAAESGVASSLKALAEGGLAGLVRAGSHQKAIGVGDGRIVLVTHTSHGLEVEELEVSALPNTEEGERDA